jgi:hypothetical protein
MQQNREHIRLWQALLADWQQKHDAEASRLQRRIADLERTIREGVEATQIAEAEAKAHQAYRSRDAAFEALCEIRLLHRDTGTGRCRCGKRLGQCPEAQIVDQYPALRRWEKEQVERYRRGEIYALPDNHPALLDAHYRLDS